MKHGSRKPARFEARRLDWVAAGAGWVREIGGDGGQRNPQQEIRKKKGRLGRPERRAARKRADWVSFNPAAPP